MIKAERLWVDVQVKPELVWAETDRGGGIWEKISLLQVGR